MNSKLTRATVVYLINKDNEVCLAQMKKAIHKDKVETDHDSTIKNKEREKEQEEISYSLGVWNGYGGKEEISDLEIYKKINIDNKYKVIDSIKYTAIRELQEESGVNANIEDLESCGAVNFFLIDKSEYNINKKFADYRVENREIFMQVHFYILRKWEGNPIESKEMSVPTFFKRKDIPYDNMMPNDRLLLERALVGGRIDSDVILLGKGVEPIVQFVL